MNPFKKLIDKVLFRYVMKSSEWSTLFRRALENNILGDTLVDPYEQHQTVFMAIDAIAQNMSQVNFKVFNNQSDEEVVDHPILKVFDYPNPTMCRFQLWEATAVFLALDGGSFWTFDDSIGQQAGTSNIPAQIWVYSQNDFSAKKDAMGRLQYWMYKNKIRLEPDQVIQFKKFNRNDSYLGFSPLIPIRKMIGLDYKAIQYNDAFFENSAEMGGYMSTDKALTEPQYKRILEQFENRHKGVKSAKKPGLLEGGLKYTPAAESHKDMEFLEQRRFNREEILGIWRVPKSLFSITDNLNYATAQSQKKLFWENTIKPMLKYIEEVLNGHFFPRYAPDVYGQFDLSEVPELQEDFTQKCQNAQVLYNIGFTANEINERLDLGFEEKPWRDLWWISSATVPADENAALNQPDPNQQDNAPPIDPQKIARLKELLSKSVTAKGKKRHSENFISGLSGIEKKMTKKFETYFYKLRVSVLKEIEKNYRPEIKKDLGDWSSFNWEKFNDLIKGIYTPFIVEATKVGVEGASAMLGAGGIDFSLFNPKIISFVKNKEMKITGVNSRIKDRISEIVQQGIQEGQAVQTVSDSIRDLFNASASQSLRIARTEVISAANGGKMLFFKESGVNKKEWVTAHDELVRESHQKLDGVSVPIDHRFPNGLMQPGGDGPAEEVINCRCTLVPVIE